MGLHREYESVARHVPIAEAAQAAPGEWQHVGLYRIAETARSTVFRIRTARIIAYAPAGHFQVYRSVGEDQRRLWVRYVHEITAPDTLPEQLPDAARLLMTSYLRQDRYVYVRPWAVDVLEAEGYAEEAAAVRRWAATRPDGGACGPRQAAAFLLSQTPTARKERAL
ncbi:hypothetical protein [Streptomyces sp. KAU_LT]|uniref:hypothetical protein n=1 Tax=Streptomyces sp. KAU_LT TaxID=3046669 RepID=UPI0024B6644A|nr:hypothetical protein [Streptomyces sp. KAU_LT]MDI9836210.1 hypothetical protein [Streptomyces sp. KAU_LT]